ncbi:uncharacterized protein [Palaemon carinicauda]|uniref:uncharacterized protein n=1 Tax=Palaemon carinicauda TaxID=392227 RepID=UPI0035B5A7D3
MKLSYLFLLLLAILSSGQGDLPPPDRSYKILMLLPASSKSHRNVFMPLAEALADRGHQIVMLTNHNKPSKHPNIQEITHGLDDFNTDNMDMFEERKNPSGGSRMIQTVLPNMARKLYQVPEVKEIYAKRKEFDLIVINHMFNEFVYPFAHEMPFITVATPGMDVRQSAVLGNPLSPAYVPGFHGAKDLDCLFGRLKNFFGHVFMAFYWRIWSLVPRIQEEIDKQFPGLPPLLEIERNQSLALLNSHFSIDVTIPLLPSQVEVGGMHCRPANPLPEDLKTWIEGAGKAGVVYFSLGSVARGDTMPVHYRNMFIEAFKRLEQRVLWKFESDLEGVSDNVKISKWLPQQDILAHPNVKVFITHGGLLSSQEASYHGTPLLAIPIFGDQPKTGEKIVDDGLGLSLVWEELTVELIVDSLQEIINNPKYANNIATVSKLSKDQLERPVDRAVFWTEYVIRHQGAPKLRSPAASLSWVQFLLVDALAVLLLVVIIILLLVRWIFKKILSIIFGSSGKHKRKTDWSQPKRLQIKSQGQSAKTLVILATSPPYLDVEQRMMLSYLPLLLLSILSCSQGDLPPPDKSYRILMLLPVSSKSHRNVFMPLAEALADRGHQVVMLTNHNKPSKHPNIREINHGLSDFNTDNINMFEARKNPSGGFQLFKTALPSMARKLYQLPEVKEIYEKRKDFDLIVINHMSNEIIYPFAHEMPFITVATLGVDYRQSAVLGNPLTPAYVPGMLGGKHLDTLFGRIKNLYGHLFVAIYWRIWAIVPLVQEEIDRQFPGLPPLLEIERNQSLALMNSHFSMDLTVPLLPSQVEVGGMQCRPANPLPEDLDTWIEDAGKAGVVYFSLGSLARGDTMPVEYRDMFVEAFKRLEQRVLWKFESDLEGVSDNVKISKWLPQQDLLAHPNVKVFITHGGLLSLQEASYHGTPLLALPIFGDQPKNGEKIVNNGLGLSLVWEELSVELIVDSLQEIINNPKYRENAAAVSKLSKDQLEHPVDRAVFWTEYVIRHQGAPKLRSPAASLTWVQFLLLDAVAVLLLAVIVILLMVRWIFKKILRTVFGSSKVHKRKSE